MANKKSLNAILKDAFKGCKGSVREGNCDDICINCSILSEVYDDIVAKVMEVLEKQTTHDWETVSKYL